MANSVNGAFNEFLKNEVNIESVDSDNAKKSRDYLLNQIHIIASNGGFVPLATSFDVSFGSFSRKTKITPLDDIDVIIGLNGNGGSMFKQKWDNVIVEIDRNSTNLALKNLCDKDYTNKYILNSNKVKNKLLSELKKIPNYSKAELHARGEAVTLNLKSYSWNFDVVPAFYYTDETTKKGYYLIPNGNGNWKITNPKFEQDRVSKLNVRFNNTVLTTIRLLKYWNRRGKMPNFTSYVLETIALDYFDQANHSIIGNDNKNYDYPDMHFSGALEYISAHIMMPIRDTKGIQNDINDLEINERVSIFRRAKSDYEKSRNAINAELKEKNYKKSISIWREIFGERFPKYE